MAAHLAGAVSATTLKPVIGVPINGSLDGLDALLSTVQMPGGIPVATVAIGKAGAKMQPIWRHKLLVLPMLICIKSLLLSVRLMQKQLLLKTLPCRNV